jgi:hypothetical protein
MVALEEVPLDAFRTTNLKGLPMEKPRGGGRASPTRRTSYMVSTPDRKSRTTPRSASPSMMMNSGGLNASGIGEGLLGDGAIAQGAIPEGATGMEEDGMEGGAGPSGAPRSPGPGTPPAIVLPGDCNTIDDEQFFPELPEMLNGLAERLSKVRLGSAGGRLKFGRPEMQNSVKLTLRLLV